MSGGGTEKDHIFRVVHPKESKKKKKKHPEDGEEAWRFWASTMNRYLHTAFICIVGTHEQRTLVFVCVAYTVGDAIETTGFDFWCVCVVFLGGAERPIHSFLSALDYLHVVIFFSGGFS